MSLALKKAIQRELKATGYWGRLDPEAFNELVKYVVQQDGNVESIHEILRAFKRDGGSNGTLSQADVHGAVTQVVEVHQPVEYFSVVDAFNIPKISWDPVQRKLYPDQTTKSIFADAQAKQRLYQDRLLTVQQRLKRNPIFQKPSDVIRGLDNAPYVELTDIQSLKGSVGCRRIILGIINSNNVGQYSLEDAGGTVPLDLSKADTTAGFFTENCVVICEGKLNADGIFVVTVLGMPPVEPRALLPGSAKRLNFFGGAEMSDAARAKLEAEEAGARQEDRIVFVADCWLNSSRVLAGLETLFEGFSNTLTPPTLFVLSGNFSSRAACGPLGADFAILQEGFAALADLISRYPRLKLESRFVIVPGPQDPTPGGTVLPQPPLPPSLTAELRRVLPDAIFATNPCRIRYLSKHLIFFRQDILKQMRRRCIIPPKGLDEGSAAASSWGHLALTLLQQSHLSPLPLLQQPVWWQHDHALSLYPLPHALLLADASRPQLSHEHEGCNVLNVGSFVDGLFAAMVPSRLEVEMSALPSSASQQAEVEMEDLDAVHASLSP